MPDPVKTVKAEAKIKAIIGNLTSKYVSKDSMNLFDGINIVPNGGAVSLTGYTFEKFTVAIAPKSGITSLYEIPGCKFSKPLIAVMKKLKKGDLVILASALVKDSQGNEITAGGSTYFITD